MNKTISSTLKFQSSSHVAEAVLKSWLESQLEQDEPTRAQNVWRWARHNQRFWLEHDGLQGRSRDWWNWGGRRWWRKNALCRDNHPQLGRVQVQIEANVDQREAPLRKRYSAFTDWVQGSLRCEYIMLLCKRYSYTLQVCLKTWKYSQPCSADEIMKLATVRSTGYHKNIYIPGGSKHLLLGTGFSSYNQRGRMSCEDKNQTYLVKNTGYCS